MITGCNTNVRHGGKLFHVQTEDSGRTYPHVISHLYHGGTILASEKTEYAELMGSANLEAEVRALIEKQHRSMLGRLKQGDFDTVIAERLEGGAGAEEGADTASPLADGNRTPSASELTAPPPEVEREHPRVFGEGIVSEKPLDEVILEYLVDKAKRRGSSQSDDPALRPLRKRE